jgi:hypothetical protein
MSKSQDKVLSSMARFNLLLAVINDEKSRSVCLTNHEKKTNNESKGKKNRARET